MVRALIAMMLLGAACTSQVSGDDGDAGPPRFTVVSEDPPGLPFADLTEDEEARFLDGDALFEAVFREPEGLGPLYIRQSCASCHASDARGPGAVTKMVVVEEDGFTPAENQDALPWGHTVRPQHAGDATTGITAPSSENVKLSTRIGPAVFGRGYIAAVRDDEILRVEAEQALRDDGIHGRANRVTYHSETVPGRGFGAWVKGQRNIVGRFGVKARVVSLEDFTADAFQGDMGITSPMRPDELPNPESLGDDGKPGVDVTLETIEKVADYMRMLRIPERKQHSGRGAQLFDDVQCSVCHVPSLRTDENHPMPRLSDVDAPIYSDLLLHDMGVELADGMTDEGAGPREWRTAPLMGLRHFRSYLHDGRARSVAQAIQMHRGTESQANGSVGAFNALGDDERAELLKFVEGL